MALDISKIQQYSNPYLEQGKTTVAPQQYGPRVSTASPGVSALNDPTFLAAIGANKNVGNTSGTDKVSSTSGNFFQNIAKLEALQSQQPVKEVQQVQPKQYAYNPFDGYQQGGGLNYRPLPTGALPEGEGLNVAHNGVQGKAGERLNNYC